jgi:pilus assembly protein CpaF
MSEKKKGDDALPWLTEPVEPPRPIAPLPAREPQVRAEAAPQPVATTAESNALLEVKGRLHKELLRSIDYSNLKELDRDQVRDQIRRAVGDLARTEAVLNAGEREQLVVQVLDEIFGLGPLEPLLQDPGISEVMVNGPFEVWVERGGKLSRTDVRFADEAHLRQIIDRIVTNVGRRIDESSPIVDARLEDGSRVAAVIPPIALKGPNLTIRKFKKEALGPEALIGFGSLNEEMLTLLDGCVKARLNILISGGTGSGKTTLLNLLSSFIPPDGERIITIEDAAELQLKHPHVVSWETRPANIQGTGAVDQRELVRASLRHRPERIILGEIRAGEAFDMLQAMGTGHPGSMATVHSNTPRDAIGRVAMLVAIGDIDLPDKVVRALIVSSIDLIVQINRMADGSRKITHITEVVGMEGEVAQLQDIFLYEQRGIDAESGKVIGVFEPTGIRPRFADQMQAQGIQLPASIFTAASRKIWED